MKFNKWTVALAAIGVVSLASAARADEAAPTMHTVQTALSSTTLSGYVDTAATWRPGTDRNSLSGATQFPQYAFAKNDGFSLNAVDIALDHPEDESPWAAGYRVELMLGPDSATGGPFGFSSTGFGVIRDAYVSLRTPVGNGIDWKVGVWDSILGYESTSSPLDPNYTRSYGYTILPQIYTGILGTYKINDMVTVQAGIADSSNGAMGLGAASTAIESQKTFLGAVSFTAPDSAGFMQGATLNLGVIDSAGRDGGPAGYTILHADATLPTPVKALKFGAAFDYDDVHNGGTGNPSNDSEWVAGLYASVQATDKLSFNTRAEYVSSYGTGLLYAPTVALSGNAAEELTATVQYNLWVNVISRVEFRWDHVEHGNFFGANAATGAVNRANDFLLALNLIYSF